MANAVLEPLKAGDEPVATAGAGLKEAAVGRRQSAGVDTDGPPRDNPWGDRSFTVVDPNGIALHIHQPIEPAPEYQSYFVHETR